MGPLLALVVAAVLALPLQAATPASCEACGGQGYRAVVVGDVPGEVVEWLLSMGVEVSLCSWLPGCGRCSALLNETNVAIVVAGAEPILVVSGGPPPRAVNLSELSQPSPVIPVFRGGVAEHAPKDRYLAFALCLEGRACPTLDPGYRARAVLYTLLGALVLAMAVIIGNRRA